jgi:molybdate transport system permease protein
VFDTSFLIPLKLSLQVATLATMFALILGVGAALIFHKYRFPGRDLADALLTLPMVLPPTVLGYYLLVVIGRNSLLGSWLEETLGISLVFTWQGAVVAATMVAFPLIFKSTRSALENIDNKYENAARTLGCGELEVFLRVSFPMALRGIMAGAMLAFARAMGEFGATLMVAGNMPGRTQTMPLAIYSAVPAGNPVNLAGPQDLKDALVRRVGITTPATSPAGNFAMTSLKVLGLWDSIEPKMIYAETVTQLMNYIQRGEVDAGFLFASDIVRGQGRVQEVSVLPLETPPAYPIAPLFGSRHPELAQKFVDLILSEKGQSIMEKYGFSRGN